MTDVERAKYDAKAEAYAAVLAIIDGLIEEARGSDQGWLIRARNDVRAGHGGVARPVPWKLDT